MKILITGAAGFVGRRLCKVALSRGFYVRAATRDPESLIGISDYYKVDQFNELTNWHDTLIGCDVIVHCAASAHLPATTSLDNLTSLRRINVDGTINLVRQAAASGIRRFILISSVAVNGSQTFEFPFNAESLPNPKTPYAISKYDAEVGLLAELSGSEMEYVIIRPPLVYGPSASGKFQLLVKSIDLGIPLPFGSIRNLRSFIALDNLIDLILVCTTHTSAANQVFLASDDQDISTLDFVKILCKSLNRPEKLIPVPVVLMKIIAKIIGKGNYAESFFGSLQLDIRKTRKLLDWTPPLTVEEALSEISLSKD